MFSKPVSTFCIVGTQLFSGRSDFRITTLKFYPNDPSIFLCGGFSSEIKAWDVRTGKVMHSFLRLLFLGTCPAGGVTGQDSGGAYMLCSDHSVVRRCRAQLSES